MKLVDFNLNPEDYILRPVSEVIPGIIANMTETESLTHEGIFRLSIRDTKVFEETKFELLSGNCDILDSVDWEVKASLLKKMLGELDEPLGTYELH